jgi:ABC-2 type transport system permease protein
MSGIVASIRHGIRGGAASAWLSTLTAAQYRANMAVWSVASVLQIVVYMSVWRAVAVAKGGSAGGYSANEFAGYFLILIIVRELTATWMPYEFSSAVRSGRLSPLLLRPLHPIISIGSGIVAYRMQSMLMVVPAAVILFVAFDAQVHTSAAAVLVGLVVLPLATTSRFLLDTLLALTSLWLVRVDGVRGIYYMLLVLLGGQFAPLDVLPHALRTIARALPFYWTLGYPTELLAGRAPVADAWLGAAVLLAWICVLFVAVRVTWRRGAVAYEAVDA